MKNRETERQTELQIDIAFDEYFQLDMDQASSPRV